MTNSHSRVPAIFQNFGAKSQKATTKVTKQEPPIKLSSQLIITAEVAANDTFKLLHGSSATYQILTHAILSPQWIIQMIWQMLLIRSVKHPDEANPSEDGHQHGHQHGGHKQMSQMVSQGSTQLRSIEIPDQCSAESIMLS